MLGRRYTLWQQKLCIRGVVFIHCPGCSLLITASFLETCKPCLNGNTSKQEHSMKPDYYYSIKYTRAVHCYSFFMFCCVALLLRTTILERYTCETFMFCCIICSCCGVYVIGNILTPVCTFPVMLWISSIIKFTKKGNNTGVHTSLIHVLGF